MIDDLIHVNRVCVTQFKPVFIGYKIIIYSNVSFFLAPMHKLCMILFFCVCKIQFTGYHAVSNSAPLKGGNWIS